MSGGSLDYFSCQLEDHVGDFGDRELDELVKDLSVLFHDREWYLSGDTGSGDWNEARDNFKAKWCTQHGRNDRIESYLDQIGREIRESLGVTHNYCQFCAHWKPEKSDKGESRYGWCEYQKHCLTHRSETCEEFENKVESE